MEFTPKNPPRTFRVGADASIEMKDCGSIALSPDDQVTFTTPAGGEYDVARKAWGFYATPSLNGRLPAHGLRPALCRNPAGQLYLLLVETGSVAAFERYLAEQKMEVVCWLDAPDAADAAERLTRK